MSEICGITPRFIMFPFILSSGDPNGSISLSSNRGTAKLGMSTSRGLGIIAIGSCSRSTMPTGWCWSSSSLGSRPRLFYPSSKLNSDKVYMFDFFAFSSSACFETMCFSWTNSLWILSINFYSDVSFTSFLSNTFILSAFQNSVITSWIYSSWYFNCLAFL